MRKYFEYEFDDSIKEQLIAYYNSPKGRGDLDNTEKKVALKIDRLSHHIPFCTSDYICDVGCSDGSLLRHIYGKYAEAVGLDISSSVIEQDKKNAPQGTTFSVYDGIHIESERQFDKIFCMDVLEHSFEPDELIKSIFQNMRGGGYLIMQVPSTGWLSELVMGKYHYGHLRYYDSAYLKTYLEKVGFEIVHLETFNSVPWSQKLINCPKLFWVLSGICSMIPHRLYPYYGSVAAVARKPQ